MRAAKLKMVKAIKAKIPTGKGKEREMKDKDFEEERAWLLLNGVPVTTTTAQGIDLSDLLEEECDLECGCCFSDVPFVRFPHPQHADPVE